jgi:hypothetical protein
LRGFFGKNKNFGEVFGEKLEFGEILNKKQLGDF